LFGQEINAETYAIAKAEFLLKGEAADNLVGGPKHFTLFADAFPGKEFDFMLPNPPYGKSWNGDQQDSQAQEECSFLKKEPKNFCSLPSISPRTRDSMKKFFASFFQKRSAYLFPSRHHPFDSYH
jgi:type I restriction-modification system DNA methylase subunit